MVLLLIALLGWVHAVSELNFLFLAVFLPNSKLWQRSKSERVFTQSQSLSNRSAC